MAKWFVFDDKLGKDMYMPFHYSFSTSTKPICNGESKLCAIYAEDDGNGKPIIIREDLTRDFIHAVQTEADHGIVALNEKYKKKYNWFTRIFG